MNVINAELCILTRLRECLRAKEIWVVGADRYRNPDEDLPQDFEAERDRYYASLNLTQDAGAFVAELQGRLGAALRALDAGLPRDPKVAPALARREAHRDHPLRAGARAHGSSPRSRPRSTGAGR